MFGKGNLAIVNQLHTAGYVHRVDSLPDAFGLEVFRQQVAAFRTAFPDGNFTVEHFIGEADKVALRFRFKGTNQGVWLGVPATGKQVDFRGTSILRIAGDKIAEQYSSDWDVMGMCKQLGAFSAPAEASNKLVLRYLEIINSH